MAKKSECYVDTSAFIGFLDRSDSYHPRFRQLFSDPPRLVTSALVIAEGHGWFLRRYDQRRAIEFLAFAGVLPDLNIVPFDGRGLQLASDVIKKYADRKLTLADSHGLAIIQELRIVNCWSTDGHLGLNGAELVV